MDRDGPSGSASASNPELVAELDSLREENRRLRARLAAVEGKVPEAPSATYAPDEAPHVDAVLDALPEHVAVLDLAGNVRAVNAPWTRFALANGGEPPAVSVGANYLDVCRRAANTGDALARSVLEGLEALVDGRSTGLVAEYPCDAPGEPRWFLMHARRTVHGPPGIIVSHLDITPRRAAELALRHSEERYRLLFDTNPHPMWVYDAETLRFLAVNDAAVVHYGYAREEFLGMTLEDIRPPEDVPHLRRVLASPRRSAAAPRDLRARHRKRDGSVIDVALASHGVLFAGRPARVVLVDDITERKRAEERLRASEERFRGIFEGSPVGVCLATEDGTIRAVNDAYSALVAVPRDALVGASYRDGIHPEDRDAPSTPIPGEDGFVAEKRLVRPDGSVRWVIVTGRRIVDPGTGERLVLRLVNDITERKAAEADLRLFREIYAHSVEGVAILDVEGRYVAHNAAHAALTGYPTSALLGHTPALLLGAEGSARMLDALEAEGAWRGEAVVRTYDGDARDVEITAFSVRDPEGRTACHVVVDRDITARKHAERALADAEAQLRQHAVALERTVAERTADLLETIAELRSFSYTVSHDLRAPLQAVRRYTDHLLGENAANLDDRGREHLRRVSVAVDRMQALTTDLLAYTRLSSQVAPLGAVDLDAVLAHVLELNPGLRDQADITIRGPLGTVRGHATLLGQILANLLGNAVAFVAPGVRPRVVVRVEARGDRRVLWVEDNGVGIDPRFHDKIFAIFERVPNASGREGSGIGLAIVARAAARMGGRCGVASTPGVGSRFWVELGAAD